MKHLPLLMAILCLSTTACSSHDYDADAQNRIPGHNGGISGGKSGTGSSDDADDPDGQSLQWVDAEYSGTLGVGRFIDVLSGAISGTDGGGSTTLTVTDGRTNPRSMVILRFDKSIETIDDATQLDHVDVTACSGDGGTFDWEQDAPDGDIEVAVDVNDSEDAAIIRYFATFTLDGSTVDGSVVLELR